MSLSDLWEKSPDEFLNKRLWQIVAMAGDGKLLDGAAASVEFRELLSKVPGEAICRWASQAVEGKAAEGKFGDSGFALQDIVNEVGRRLGFKVLPGRYSGGRGQSYDGIWQVGKTHSIVVETKAIGTYVNLKKVVEYRQELIRSGRLTEQASSMLWVIGREVRAIVKNA